MTDKPSFEEQMRELEDDWREEARENPQSSYVYRKIEVNLYRYSPKMRCWLYRIIFDEMFKLQEGLSMPRDQKSARADGEDTAAWGFVNVTLDEDERDAATVQFQDVNLLWEMLVTAMQDGYKVTLSYDPETASFCAALSGVRCGKPNERFTLTAWSKSETEALQYLVYKHCVKLEYIWNKPGVRPARIG